MAAIPEITSDQITNEDLFKRLETYPWTSDEDFQSGLRAIVEANPEQDRETLILQARCFYYSRKHNLPIDSLAYQQWHKDRQQSKKHRVASTIDQSGNPSEEEAIQQMGVPEKPPYPLSFNHLVALITEGKEIPGIKDIPDTVLEGQNSQSTQTQRKKPWEK